MAETVPCTIDPNGPDRAESACAAPAPPGPATTPAAVDTDALRRAEVYGSQLPERAALEAPGAADDDEDLEPEPNPVPDFTRSPWATWLYRA